MYTAEEKVTVSPFQNIDISNSGGSIRIALVSKFTDKENVSAQLLSREQVIELIEKLAKVAEQLPK